LSGKSLAHSTENMRTFTIEIDREEDGRWIADVPEVPGALAYGATQEQAAANAEAIALRALADEIEENGRSLALTIA
jgi:predicted RNase H-like HicB family nuclease